ncbi:hypothetical protein M8998_15080 [Sphingobacterium sp. lm-10]|uniref:hypothetical protein n=1 Tax=Sphingobacterium sp. lm-10 TaxID=2944904 RepID=UPI00202258C0|nr:hypothetical protein [Sphingobacterium sp. lm-10]MCL7989272.1 hypothetical protein [Sphingobacterium sp. lm-10]
MKIKFLGLYALILLTAVSCKRELEGFDKTLPRHADSGDGGLDVLGYGYDVINGKYALAESATRRVIDVRKLKGALPGRVRDFGGTYVTYPMKSEESYEKYKKSKALTVDIKSGIKVFGLSLFGSDFNTSFDQSILNETTRSFAQIDMSVKTATLEILSDGSNYNYLLGYLDTDFLNACNTLTADQLINVYGIGILRKIDVGGKLTLNYSSVISNGDKSTTVKAGGAAAFKFLFNVDLTTSFSYTQQDVNRNTNHRLAYQSMGGTGAIGITHANLNQPASFNPNVWSSTVTRSNSVLINLYDDSFILLHELIPNTEKAKLVRDLIYERLGMINSVYASNGKLLAKVWGSPNLDDYAFTSFEQINLNASPNANVMAHNVILNRGGTTDDNEYFYTGLGGYHYNHWEAQRFLGVERKKLNPAIKYKVAYKYMSYGPKPIPNASSYQIKQLPPTSLDEGRTWYQASKTITGVTSFEECCFVAKVVDDFVVYPEGSKIELYLYSRHTGNFVQTIVFD